MSGPVGRGRATLSTRVKALESTGVIQRYVALTDSAALGLGLNVFTSISLKDQPRESLAEFERRIDEQDEIMECYLRTGDSDYLITRRLARHRSA